MLYCIVHILYTLVDKVLHRSNTIPGEKRSRVTSEDFLADIIRTLIYSRHIMAISYVISYFIVDNTEAINHRHMQVILKCIKKVM